jgi:hypothetical protein
MTSDVAKLKIKNLLLEKYPAVTKVLSKKKVNQLIKDVYQVCSDDFDSDTGRTTEEANRLRLPSSYGATYSERVHFTSSIWEMMKTITLSASKPGP